MIIKASTTILGKIPKRSPKPKIIPVTEVINRGSTRTGAIFRFSLRNTLFILGEYVCGYCHDRDTSQIKAVLMGLFAAYFCLPLILVAWGFT